MQVLLPGSEGEDPGFFFFLSEPESGDPLFRYRETSTLTNAIL
jgi:hypothetical protein